MSEATDREDALRGRLLKSGIPEGMHDGYVLYLVWGFHPGSFLVAVLSNNLLEAFKRADVFNREAMFQHVAFLCDNAPADAWGSPENVAAWVQKHREARQALTGTGQTESLRRSAVTE